MAWNTRWIPLLVLIPTILATWSSREDRRDLRRAGGQPHYHSKRHMLSPSAPPASPTKRHPLSTKPSRPGEHRFQRSSNVIKPLEDEDIMDNDETFSVAIGPPPIRPKYDKSSRKITNKLPENLTRPGLDTSVATDNIAVNLIKNILSELSKQFIFKQTDENFIFGQYLGNSMKNLTKHLRLQMQHDIVDLIVKYETLNLGESAPAPESKADKKVAKGNETEDLEADYSTLAKIVGR